MKKKSDKPVTVIQPNIEALEAKLKLDEEVLQEIWEILHEGDQWSTEDLGYISGALDRWKPDPE